MIIDVIRDCRRMLSVKIYCYRVEKAGPSNFFFSKSYSLITVTLSLWYFPFNKGHFEHIFCKKNMQDHFHQLK